MKEQQTATSTLIRRFTVCDEVVGKGMSGDVKIATDHAGKRVAVKSVKDTDESYRTLHG